MFRRPPRSTRTDILCPYTTLFRSLAARIAEAKGIDLAGISGTGPGGLIVKADLGLSPMLAPAPAMAAAQPLAPTPAAIAPPPEGVPVEAVKLSSMRKTIARRLTESSEERRVGTECVSTFISRWSPV